MEITRVIKGSVFFIVLFLCACSSRIDLAPVEEHFWQDVQSFPDKTPIASSKPKKDSQDSKSLNVNKIIKKDIPNETKNNLPKKEILKHTNVINKVAPKQKNQPNVIHKVEKTQKNRAKELNAKNNLTKKWFWPSKGKIVTQFAPKNGKNGINIRGTKGDKIIASNNGVVAYAGDGLQGYGNLIIIKHKNQYLTAYGNNLRNLVKEGDKVKEGQVIAEMGVIDRKYWGVHFEIRKSGIPVNPLIFLMDKKLP